MGTMPNHVRAKEGISLQELVGNTQCITYRQPENTIPQTTHGLLPQQTRRHS
ncbi:MAG: hypothetical protein SPG61_01225 [Arcanobacterium sp.]|nr:hypothetical protein [Arcanobacterium sp.]